ANPAAAGLDGRPPADPSGGGVNTQTIIGVGRDPSVAVADDGSTAITWIDAANNIHLRTYDDTGVQVTNITLGGATATAGGTARPGPGRRRNRRCLGSGWRSSPRHCQSSDQVRGARTGRHCRNLYRRPGTNRRDRLPGKQL